MGLQWSKAMERLYFHHVVQPVMNDRRTDWDENISLGFPFQVIRDEVIQMGLADFSAGHAHSRYGKLSADEKVLLYCFTNMKLHFYESLSTFRRHRVALQEMFASHRSKFMIDLGCGPGTACLALAESLDRPKLSYFGVDAARPMLNKAKSMLQAAVDVSLLAVDSRIATTSSWSKIRELGRNLTDPVDVLMNATYLFASSSLEVDHVCDLVMAFKDNPRTKRLLFTYSNTCVARAGMKFTEFKQKLKNEFASTGCTKQTISFHKKRLSDATVEATYLRQLLVFKE